VTPLPMLALQSTAATPLERTVAVVADVATIVIALALIAVGVLVIHATRRARAALRGVRADLAPAVRSLGAAADNVEAVSRVARREAERVGSAVQATAEQVQGATERVAQRLRELDALVAVAQAEAEEAFVRTAAAVRGVQVGAGALRGPRRSGDAPPPDPAGPGGGRDALD
jgi:hypothetical protein